MDCRDEIGAVTAEAAVVLPLLVLFTLALCWLVSIGVQQARVVDAARETARALARDPDQAKAFALGRQVAPPGARFEVTEEDGTVRVTVEAHVRGPGIAFPGFDAHATALAALEVQP